MAVFWFGGPRQGTGDIGGIIGGGAGQTGVNTYGTGVTGIQGGNVPAGYSFGGRVVQPRGTTPIAQAIGGGGGSLAGGGRTNLNVNLRSRMPGANPALFAGGGATGGTTPTGGGTGGTAAGGTSPNPMQDVLNDEIRRLRSMGQVERGDIAGQAWSRGMGRSAGALMNRQRQREAQGVTDVQRNYLAEQFKSNAERERLQQQMQLERERMQQEMQLALQRAQLERELLQARLSAESQQSQLDRESREATAGGGGGVTSIGGGYRSDNGGGAYRTGGQDLSGSAYQGGMGYIGGQNIAADMDRERLRQSLAGAFRI